MMEGERQDYLQSCRERSERVLDLACRQGKCARLD